MITSEYRKTQHEGSDHSETWQGSLQRSPSTNIKWMAHQSSYKGTEFNILALKSGTADPQTQN